MASGYYYVNIDTELEWIEVTDDTLPLPSHIDICKIVEGAIASGKMIGGIVKFKRRHSQTTELIHENLINAVKITHNSGEEYIIETISYFLLGVPGTGSVYIRK